MSDLDKMIGDMAPKGQRRFVIMDTIIDMVDVNENSRQPVNTTVKVVLGGLARRHNATILYAAHPSKSSDYSGSTAWPGSSRFMLYLKKVEGFKDLRQISKGKANYSDDDDGFQVMYEKGAFHKIDAKEFEREAQAEDERAIWNEIHRAYIGDEENYRLSHAAHPRYVKNYLDVFQSLVAHPEGLTIERLKRLINNMKADGRLDEEQGKGLIAMNF
jgi:RecA-family ATPase